MSGVDSCKLYERLTIRFEETCSKTNNINDTKSEVSVKDLFNPHFYADTFTSTKGILNGKVHFCALICACK